MPANRQLAGSRELGEESRKGLENGEDDALREDGGDDGLRGDEFWALKDISFDLKKGECLGLLGVNGSGKTTLLRLLTGIFPPDKGEISVRGRTGALISVGAGFHPYLSGRENIYLNGAILGMTRGELDSRFDEIVDFSGIDSFLEAPVSTYSSGMKIRLGFAIATAIKPDLLLLDEILAVGDANFRTKCYQRIGKVIESSAVIFVTHDVVQTSRICDSAIVLDKGKNRFHGDTEEGIEKYLEGSMSPRSFKPIAVKDADVVDIYCTGVKSTLIPGDSLDLEIGIETVKDLSIGMFLVNIVANEMVSVQCDISENIEIIKKGKTIIRLELGPMWLRRDKYYIALTITNKSKKKTLAHTQNSFRFSMGGSRGYGAPYQLPHKNALKNIKLIN